MPPPEPVCDPERRAAWLAVAHALADRACAISLRGFRSAQAVDYKPDRSPVTPIDRAVETMLREQLAVHCPGHGVVGEEFASTGAEAGFVWHIDPIDGTRSYVCGLPLWGTLIALVQGDVPLLGLLDAPAMAERWSAVRGGTTLWQASGRPAQACRTSACATLEQARLCAPAPDAFDAAQAGAYRRLAARVAINRQGGDCYAYGLLAAGHLDLLLEAGLDPHDFLPMVVLIESAGGVVSDWAGRSLGPHSDGTILAAATTALHRQALALLA